MGIESVFWYRWSPLFYPACKKSPQTWGLKVLTLENDSTPREAYLQKESPNMGIESLGNISSDAIVTYTCKKSPQTWGLKAEERGFISPQPSLQKESPNMGIESSGTSMATPMAAGVLQKESPNMGIERLFP